MMEPYHFAERDIKLVIQLWSDFKVKFCREVRMPDIWAAGAILILSRQMVSTIMMMKNF